MYITGSDGKKIGRPGMDPKRKREPKVWLHQLREYYGAEILKKVIGCGRVQLGGYINGSYKIPDRMKSSCLFLLVCMERGFTPAQLTGMVHEYEVDRHVTDYEKNKKQNTLDSIDRYRDRSDPERVLHKENMNVGGKASADRSEGLDFT